jgi:PKD-like domain
MKLFLRATFTAAVFAILAASTFAKSWHGITPLKSNRDDVAKVLNQSITPDAQRFEYDSEVELVEFLFAKPDALTCMETLTPGTVLTIDITPKIETYLSDLQPEQKKLRQLESSPEFLIDGDAYFDDDEGFIATIRKGTVRRVVYIAAKSDRHLCPTPYQEPQYFADRIICRLCPTVAVTCPDETEVGSPIVFTASIAVGDPAPEITYQWTVTTGTIVEGQGTNSIKVDTKNLAHKTITATVKVGGIDAECNSTASCTTPITAHKN